MRKWVSNLTSNEKYFQHLLLWLTLKKQYKYVRGGKVTSYHRYIILLLKTNVHAQILSFILFTQHNNAQELYHLI